MVLNFSKKIFFFIDHLFNLKVQAKYSMSKQKLFLFERFYKPHLFLKLDQHFRILEQISKKILKKIPQDPFLIPGINPGK